MTNTGDSLSTKMRTASGLTVVFVIAIAIALIITLTSVSVYVQLLAVGSVTPIIILDLIFIIYCKKRRRWSYAGASILGAIGVCIRVVVSTQPNLEVGGGLPTEVTIFYIVLGALVSLMNYEAFVELRGVRA